MSERATELCWIERWNFGEPDTRRWRRQLGIDSYSPLIPRTRSVREMICSESFASLAKDSSRGNHSLEFCLPGRRADLVLETALHEMKHD